MYQCQTVVMVLWWYVGMVIPVMVVPLAYRPCQVQPVGIPWGCGVAGLENGCWIIHLHAQLDHGYLVCVQCCNFPRKYFVQLVELAVEDVVVTAAQH